MKKKSVIVLTVFMITSLLSQVGYASSDPVENPIVSESMVVSEMPFSEVETPPAENPVGGEDVDPDGSVLSELYMDDVSHESGTASEVPSDSSVSDILSEDSSSEPVEEHAAPSETSPDSDASDDMSIPEESESSLFEEPEVPSEDDDDMPELSPSEPVLSPSENMDAGLDPSVDFSDLPSEDISVEFPVMEESDASCESDELLSNADISYILNPAADSIHLANPVTADANGNVLLSSFDEDPFIDFLFPECIVGQQVKSIGAQAFRDCWFLRTVVIPNTVFEIGAEAFAECSNLERIILLDRADTNDMILGEHWSGNAEVVYGLIADSEAATSIEKVAPIEPVEESINSSVSSEKEAFEESEVFSEPSSGASDETLEFAEEIVSEDQETSIESDSACETEDIVSEEPLSVPMDGNLAPTPVSVPKETTEPDVLEPLISDVPEGVIPTEAKSEEPA